MVSFVFHTHLPFVLNHGTWPHGSDWLCEAVAECYIPILNACNELVSEGMRPGVTFDISPILCEQLAHLTFPDVFKRYCEEHVGLAEVDIAEFKKEDETDERIGIAEFWIEFYTSTLSDFESVYHSDIVGALRSLQDEAAIEMMTCGATHGYFALLAEDASINLQVRLAVDNHTKHFGKPPKGIWLPECAYRPRYNWRTLIPNTSYSLAKERQGVEEILQSHDLRYFVIDQGALNNATPRGYVDHDGNYTPYEETIGEVRSQLDQKSPMDVFSLRGNSEFEPVKVLTRSMDAALQVWSGQSGYPGDPDYLDFHKRYHKSAIRYWRVTDNQADMQHKRLYNPQWAVAKTKEHAAHYVSILETMYRHRAAEQERQAVICLPFDTELFGHWWFEGPNFLKNVLIGIHNSTVLSTATASECIEASERGCLVDLPESSWGKNGNHDVWMSPETQWTWEKEYELESKVRRVFELKPETSWDSVTRRVMKNLVREMLLAQASDWQFLISTFSAKEYAEMRFHSHHSDATKLCGVVERCMNGLTLTDEDEKLLTSCEKRNNVFEDDLDRLLGIVRADK